MYFLIPGAQTPIDELLYEKRSIIDQWFVQRFLLSKQMPFYGSYDIRSCAFKLACVDANAFPAGFNHIQWTNNHEIINNVRRYIHALHPEAKKIAILCEKHTRNHGYIENTQALTRLIASAGFQVVLTHPDADKQHPHLQPCSIREEKLHVQNEVFDVVLLNNDLSDDMHAFACKLKQPTIPPTSLGWATRKKSTHYAHKKQIDYAFAKATGIDPFHIGLAFDLCPHVHFGTHEGFECIKHHADVLFTHLHRLYGKHNISHPPFVVIKSDKGTYGMAVMKIFSVKDLDSLNRKTRNQMSKEKNGRVVNQIILQEGVPTELHNHQGNAHAEACIYHLNDHTIGGFLRTHSNKNSYDNLNRPDTLFEQLQPHAHCSSKWYAHTVASRLSLLALAEEMQTI